MISKQNKVCSLHGVCCPPSLMNSSQQLIKVLTSTFQEQKLGWTSETRSHPVCIFSVHIQCLSWVWGGQRQTGTGIWNLQQHIFISWAAPLSCPSMLLVLGAHVQLCVSLRRAEGGTQGAWSVPAGCQAGVFLKQPSSPFSVSRTDGRFSQASHYSGTRGNCARAASLRSLEGGRGSRGGGGRAEKVSSALWRWQRYNLPNIQPPSLLRPSVQPAEGRTAAALFTRRRALNQPPAVGARALRRASEVLELAQLSRRSDWWSSLHLLTRLWWTDGD